MLRISWRLTPALAIASLLLLGAGRVAADNFLSPPGAPCAAPPVVSYYAPSVSYYAPPAVSYYAAPAVSYYAPSVSYYPPAVSYYAPAVSYYPAPAVSYYYGPAAVTTTRYGLFGRPRVSTTYYP
jgi:hypothetical protein